jgi:uncharacterized protein YcfL
MADKKKVSKSQDTVMIEELLLAEGIEPPAEPLVESEAKPSKKKKAKKKKKSKKKKKPRKVVKKYYYDDESSCVDDLMENMYECLIGWWRD